jgi:hypothetical protein
MATIQVRVDDRTKTAVDSRNGIPFAVVHRVPIPDLQEAITDTRLRRSLNGTFKTAEETVASLLKD